MKRVALTIVVFLLAGAVVNVAVAWGCAWWPRDAGWWGESVDQDPSPIDITWWNKHVFPLYGTELLHLFETRDLGVDWRILRGPYFALRAECAIHVSSGWPARSMSGETWEAWVFGQRQPSESSNRLAMFVGVGEWPGLMPLRPVWPGFAINTAFYAAILWLIIPGPFALRRLIRRQIRRRRGLCPKCAYPMGESAVCSECGNKLPKRVRPAT